MLVLGTLIVTWIVRNWWKLLLVLVLLVVLLEYQKRKQVTESEEPQDHGSEKDKDQ